MKKGLFLTLVLTAFLCCLALKQAQAVSLRLNVLDDYITVGESFDVEVWVDGGDIGEDLLGFGFDVDTPGTYFSYSGYTLDPFVWPGDLSIPPDNVTAAGLAFDDDVLLATLSFDAISEGVDDLSLSGLYDGFFYGVFYEFSGFDIDISTGITVNAAPIPEPATATMFLLGSGIFGLAGIRRKIKK